jgi:hypothetical protein
MVDRDAGWPLRSPLLGLLGGGIGLALYALVSVDPAYEKDVGRVVMATFLTAGGMVLAFTLERIRWAWAAAFALVSGLVVAGVTWSNGAPDGWDQLGPWRHVCAGLAVAIAAPLFQAIRDEGKWNLPYRTVHRHVWTNAIIWCAAWLFVGLVWLLSFLLASLFDLIGIDQLQRLLNRAWFAHLLTGASFGGAVGLLRERERIMGLLQRLATLALGVLAPVLAIGLIIFLLALPFTGLSPLWEATKSTTPILLSCVIAALVLANVVIGDGPEDEDEAARPLRWSAMALGAVILPLGLIAAVSTGLRIAQYGLTPDRLWAATFTAIAIAYGLAYLAALLWRRLRWSEALRPANLGLAIGLCGLALLLATPLINFNAFSARDQAARLRSGRTPLDEFDWKALAFDFGKPGREVLEKLARAGPTQPIRNRSKQVLAFKTPWDFDQNEVITERAEGFAERVTIVPIKVALPEALLAALPAHADCGRKEGGGHCVVQYRQGADSAVFVSWTADCSSCRPEVQVLVRGASGSWGQAVTNGYADPKEPGRQRTAALRGDIEIRPVERRQVFIGGEPAGAVFE